ncbi:hypothetical protein EKK58_06125 [Candidatus Dependentiae bacterium]|nr:MAG: hypothetical protein EKK58_06125 [Candidatus Dependentiae bacterium]
MKLTINNIEIDTDYYIKKWVNIALEATPATDEQIKNNINKLYKKSGLKEPKDIFIYRDYEKFLGHDWNPVGNSVWDSVGNSVGNSVVGSVVGSVWGSVWDSVGSSVGNSIWNSVWNSIGNSIWNSVGNSVWDSVGSSVGNSVWDSVWDSVGSSVGNSVWNSVYYRADDLAFADVFVDTKVLSQDKIEEMKEWKEILCSYRIACLFENVAIVMPAPIIRKNEEGQLHNEQRPAVEWENCTGQYYLDGVNLTKEMWQRIISKEMSLSKIMKIEISDIRTIALKYNPQAIIKENAKLISRDDRNNELYLVENSEINKLTNYPKMYFLKMTCPTGRVFIEGVDPEFAEANPDATACQAELCGLIKSEYLQMELEA